MAEPLVRQELFDGAIAVLTLNRPEKLNALSTPLWPSWTGARPRSADPAIRVVILTGAGRKAFAAGADIAEYRGRRERAFQSSSSRAGASTTSSRRCPSRRSRRSMDTRWAAAGDRALLRRAVVSTSARLGLPEGQLGLSPGGGRHAAADPLVAGT
jgi:enoyl-CoA hydratase/carnithine racemase